MKSQRSVFALDRIRNTNQAASTSNGITGGIPGQAFTGVDSNVVNVTAVGTCRMALTGVYDHLAVLTAGQGRFVEAMAFVEHCRQILDEMDRPYIVASLSLSLSQIAMQAGDLSAAEDHVGRALRVARDTGNQFDLVHFLLQLGTVAVARGDYAAALAAYREAAAVGQEIHAESLMVHVVAGLADRAWVMGRKTLATTLFRFAQSHPSASQETISRTTGRLIDPTLRPLASIRPLNIDEALDLGLRSDRNS